VIAVVMATIGLASILRGVGPFTIFSGTKPLPLPIRDERSCWADLHPAHPAAGCRGEPGLPRRIRLVFLKSRKGIAMRAVADNQQVAMAMGSTVERYFGVAVGDDRRGLCARRHPVGQPARRRRESGPGRFKVFPVVILGGLDSFRRDLGGLIVASSRTSRPASRPYVGGGTKDFAPYVLMILALMIPPYGIFGKRIIERV